MGCPARRGGKPDSQERAGLPYRGQQPPGRYVYFLKPDLKTLVPVITDYTQPNGIIGTPDGKPLYVADMSGNATYRFTIKGKFVPESGQRKQQLREQLDAANAAA